MPEVLLGNGAGKALNICINRLLPHFGYKIKGKANGEGIGRLNDVLVSELQSEMLI